MEIGGNSEGNDKNVDKKSTNVSAEPNLADRETSNDSIEILNPEENDDVLAAYGRARYSFCRTEDETKRSEPWGTTEIKEAKTETIDRLDFTQQRTHQVFDCLKNKNKMAIFDNVVDNALSAPRLRRLQGFYLVHTSKRPFDNKPLVSPSRLYVRP
mmetsp:Transcript_10954/g.20972  ORF Transcript_10954/g.20972 Transcript_10954/m.20972 type:complete len:156 (-) Transcript_10954:296-763(-)|eukprot:CAMPEP_0170174460 /NCGR_PEP_ID=MMETSP0040_2-20121228/7684_1 /TAXON_ID=641309 /ORGANISM="Lotharella oceanica, Strain CCMP622" /LENGTH=155 /DNA_ID=CAMNT_0010416099 /DNA_START=132 /DNA_END=599 /DNA_ORIENTATION=-